MKKYDNCKQAFTCNQSVFCVISCADKEDMKKIKGKVNNVPHLIKYGYMQMFSLDNQSWPS